MDWKGQFLCGVKNLLKNECPWKWTLYARSIQAIINIMSINVRPCFIKLNTFFSSLDLRFSYGFFGLSDFSSIGSPDKRFMSFFTRKNNPIQSSNVKLNN